MGAKNLSYVKYIATYALKFFGYIISVLASVHELLLKALNCHQLARTTLTNLALDTEIVMSPDVHRLFAIFMPNS